MNSFASISFLILFLFKGMIPGVDLGCELQKIPNLIHHYQEHKACNDGSFWQFLINDYLNMDGQSKDHQDDSGHENLPFHGTHQCSHSSVFYASAAHFSGKILKFSSQIVNGGYTSFYASEFIDSPFQPPKV